MLWDPNSRPREPEIDNHGLFARHDQRCAVLKGEHAVFDCNEGVFHPSWKAQSDGWQLIRADTWWRRLLVRAAQRR